LEKKCELIILALEKRMGKQKNSMWDWCDHWHRSWLHSLVFFHLKHDIQFPSETIEVFIVQFHNKTT